MLKKSALIILIGSAVLTLLLFLGWIAGFIFAFSEFGALVHLLLVASMLSSFGIFIGVVLLVINYFVKKKG